MVSKIDLLNFLKNIINFNEFENELSKLTNQTEKGDLFELFCQAYLEVIHPQEFKIVTLFKQTSHSVLNKLNLKITKDYGIDLIAITNSDEIWTIQSKFRQSNHVTWRELSTFRSSSEKADFMLVMGNINQVLHPHKTLSRYSSILKYDFEKLDKNDFSKIRNYLGAKEKVEIYKPRIHQVKAIGNAIKHYGTNDKGQMIHACGTGKTLTSLWIKEKLKPKTTIVYLPSLALLKQTLEQWTKHLKDKFNIKCVCSDVSVIRETEIDEPEIDIQELGVPVTTSEEEIIKFLKSKGNKVVFSTYQSAPVILNSIKSLNFKFDFGIFDEAHRTASKSNKLFTKCLDTAISKSLFMTATPKLYAPALKKKAEEEEVMLCSMDDENIYGEVFDEVKFGEAIKLGLLSDYKIKVMVVNNDMIKELIDRRYWLEILGRELTADELAKAWALIQSMKNVNHVISFHSKIKNAKDFQTNIKQVIEYLNEKGKQIQNIETYHISGKHPAYLRSEILKEFIEDEKSLVTNARCLTEGVDVPAIDGVYFVDPKQNLIDIVQATGRAIRKKKTKYGYVIIPVYIKDKQEIDDVISSSAFEQVWKVVEAMKDQDQRLQQIISDLKILEGRKKFGSLKSRELNEQRKLRGDLANVLDLEDSILPKNIDIKDFVEKIGIKTLEIIGGNWDERFGEYVAFREERGREPTNHSRDKFEKSIGMWASHQRNDYNKKIRITQDRINKLNSIGFVWNMNDMQWEQSSKDYQKFREKYNREPFNHSKDKFEKFLAKWIGTQKDNYKKNKLSKERVSRLNFIGLIWDVKEVQWIQSFQYYKEFKEKHNREPSTKSKNKLEKDSGNWASRQRIRYNKKDKLSKERIDKLNSIDFIWGLKEAQWIQLFQDYKEFKEKHNSEPSHGSKNKLEKLIVVWANTQRIEYNKKNLLQHRINKLNSIGFIWNQKKHLWGENFEEYKTFKAKHNREPSQISKDKSEELIGDWASRQRMRYNKKDKLSQERIDKLNSIGFVWDTFDFSWNQSFNNYQIFKKRYNREPSEISKDKSEKFIGLWARSQRSLYKRNKLPRDRIKKLNLISFIWNPLESLWEKSFKDYRTFKEEHGKEPLVSSKINSEKSIAYWTSDQRKTYKKNKLPKERINKLNSIGFIWDIFISSWEQSFKDYLKFKEKYNCEPSHGSKNKSEKDLADWTTKQRKAYKIKKLPKERINKLNSIGFVWDLLKDLWERPYNEYKQFIEKHVRKPMETSRDKSEKRLGIWASKNIVRYNKGKLSKERINKLNSIGFIWNTLESSWEESFKGYRVFKEKYDKEPSRNSKEKSEKSLGTWASRQRINCKKNKLPKERIDKLNSISLLGI